MGTRRMPQRIDHRVPARGAAHVRLALVECRRMLHARRSRPSPRIGSRRRRCTRFGNGQRRMGWQRRWSRGQDGRTSAFAKSPTRLSSLAALKKSRSDHGSECRREGTLPRVGGRSSTASLSGIFREQGIARRQESYGGLSIDTPQGCRLGKSLDVRSLCYVSGNL